eukprot:scaffold2430_cov159-Amphora_coffeaeformis.AAC.10
MHQMRIFKVHEFVFGLYYTVTTLHSEFHAMLFRAIRVVSTLSSHITHPNGSATGRWADIKVTSTPPLVRYKKVVCVFDLPLCFASGLCSLHPCFASLRSGWAYQKPHVCETRMQGYISILFASLREAALGVTKSHKDGPVPEERDARLP